MFKIFCLQARPGSEQRIKFGKQIFVKGILPVSLNSDNMMWSVFWTTLKSVYNQK